MYVKNFWKIIYKIEIIDKLGQIDWYMQEFSTNIAARLKTIEDYIDNTIIDKVLAERT